MTSIQLPPLPAQIHFIGIGGIGMSGLARMVQEMGYQVSGSDSTPSSLIDELRSTGIPVSIGHEERNLPPHTTLVVRSSAVTDANPEMVAAIRQRVLVIKRAELLGAISSSRTTIAVAGTHGKSTTSAMITSALQHLGLEPSYAVGAILQSTQTNASLGNGQIMVVEADEYDRSFLTLGPAFAIITSVEFDHPDIFAGQAEYEQAFLDFTALIKTGGSLVIRGDQPGAARVASTLGVNSHVNVRTFGTVQGLDWNVAELRDNWLLCGPEDQSTTIGLQVPGEYNALNALAAVAALVEMEIDFMDAADAVASYRGIVRRFEVKGEEHGILVVDDYAHHPSEVAAVLTAARAKYPDRRVWAAFQPHTFSRTSALLDEFAHALALVDQRVVLDVYGAREVSDGSITDNDMALLAGPDGYRATNIQEASSLLATIVEPGDVVLTLGAGDITALGPMLLECIAASQANGN